MSSNGDTDREFKVGKDPVRGLGSFHKTLPHNEFGEVDPQAFQTLVSATRGDGSGFANVHKGSTAAAKLTNPQAGFADDQLTRNPAAYSMPPAPGVLSVSTAAEMTELYWMALLRDVGFDEFNNDAGVKMAAAELDTVFRSAVVDKSDVGRLEPGRDLPGAAGTLAKITAQNLFRVGLPGEESGPLVSQFFIRNVPFGTQTISQEQKPYKAGRNYLTDFDAWLNAQNSGRDANGQDYSKSNEDSALNFENCSRLISTPRDLARFVNKDALHQAYFNAALIMLAGGAKWTQGNPYGDGGRLECREAGFGVLGGPHILALVSEVATRALKIVWNQKWQVHLRLRPEGYGGLAHVQFKGIDKDNRKRPYGLPKFLDTTKVAKRLGESYLLPMAFTAGSPTHPAYGAGHATVAGACVTVLKAYFQTFYTNVKGEDILTPFGSLSERMDPFGKGVPITMSVTGVNSKGQGTINALPKDVAEKLTLEGELNKLASNVAMGRSIGGVHWRSDNTRSLILGEAIAAQILADISTDVNEKPEFTFRTFARRADGQPKKVRISNGHIFVDGVLVDTHSSSL